MKQTSKQSTHSVTGIRLDQLCKARLGWIQAYYNSCGESVSNSIIIRRAIQLLLEHLETVSSTAESNLLDAELRHLLSAANNKACSLVVSKPWVTDARPAHFSEYLSRS